MDWHELDSHADTMVSGSNCVLLSSTGETAMVHSFLDERKPFDDIVIGMTATAWVNPGMGETFILVFPESLYFGDKLGHSLVCPNQLRVFGIRVNDTPCQYSKKLEHAITVPEEDDLKIPLSMRGVISYFPTHKPSEEEFKNCRRIVMCSDQPWDPNNPSFETQEDAAT